MLLSYFSIENVRRNLVSVAVVVLCCASVSAWESPFSGEVVGAEYSAGQEAADLVSPI